MHNAVSSLAAAAIHHVYLFSTSETPIADEQFMEQLQEHLPASVVSELSPYVKPPKKRSLKAPESPAMTASAPAASATVDEVKAYSNTSAPAERSSSSSSVAPVSATLQKFTALVRKIASKQAMFESDMAGDSEELVSEEEEEEDVESEDDSDDGWIASDNEDIEYNTLAEEESDDNEVRVSKKRVRVVSSDDDSDASETDSTERIKQRAYKLHPWTPGALTSFVDCCALDLFIDGHEWGVNQEYPIVAEGHGTGDVVYGYHVMAATEPDSDNEGRYDEEMSLCLQSTRAATEQSNVFVELKPLIGAQLILCEPEERTVTIVTIDDDNELEMSTLTTTVPMPIVEAFFFLANFEEQVKRLIYKRLKPSIGTCRIADVLVSTSGVRRGSRPACALDKKFVMSILQRVLHAQDVLAGAA